MSLLHVIVLAVVQGLAELLPVSSSAHVIVAEELIRGFSRSGATISTGMLLGVGKVRSEDFSFALAVILTPAAIAREAWRLIQTQHGHLGSMLTSAVVPSVLGAVFAFLAGLLALKWLSRWLETGRWYVFGVYCLVAAAVVMSLALHQEWIIRVSD